jgi:hypothetical protein
MEIPGRYRAGIVKWLVQHCSVERRVVGGQGLLRLPVPLRG